MARTGMVGIGGVAVAVQMSVYYLKVQQIFSWAIMCALFPTEYTWYINGYMRSQSYHHCQQLIEDIVSKCWVVSNLMPTNEAVDCWRTLYTSVKCPGEHSICKNILYSRSDVGLFLYRGRSVCIVQPVSTASSRPERIHKLLTVSNTHCCITCIDLM